MIRVTLINPSDRKFFQAQWDDPVTGKTKTKSAKTTIRREAERFAARLEDELNNGTYRPYAETTWAELQERYTTEVSAGKADKTRHKTKSMFNAVADLIGPKMASSMADPNAVSQFGAKLRQPQIITSKKGKKRELRRRPFTIKGHLAELRKVLRWAKRMNIIREVPHIEFPECTETMKGRPLTLEEFERMLEAIKKTEDIQSDWRGDWAWMLRGLWLSGLRIDEALKFHWKDDTNLCPDFTGRRPMLRIQAKSEKGRTFRMLPMTPDFAQFLEKVPERNRRGFVFNPWTKPPLRWGTGRHRPTANHVGRVISQLGKLAGIKVKEDRFATAHDLRRTFGQRWAKLVMPKVLQELMRHDSIQTTMAFYVGKLAEDAADAVWNAMALPSGNSSGNTLPADLPKNVTNSNKTG